MIPITERVLSEWGGWQALQEARRIHAAGRVLAAGYAPPLLEGRVREGSGELRSGLRIEGKSRVENLCGCRAARRDGVICAHALAVGLEWLKPQVVPEPVVAPVGRAAAGPRFRAEEGEPMELHVVLPRNFATAWERDALTLGAEAALGKRRVLLSALDAGATYQVSPGDQAVVELLRVLGGGELPGIATLDRTAFARLLPALAGHPRVTFAKTTPARVHAQPFRPAPELPPEALLLATGEGAWLLHEDAFHPLAPEVPRVAPAAGPACAPSGFALALEGSLNHLTARIEVRYGEHRFVVEAGPVRGTITPRDPAAEQGALDRLHAAGFSGPDRTGQMVLKGEPGILAFFARDLPRLEKEWAVEIGSRFAHVTRDIERIQPHFEIRTSGESWFDLKYELATGSGDRFSAGEIQRLLQSGQNSTRLKNRKIAVFDPGMLNEFQEVLTDCNPQQHQPGAYRIARCHAAYFGEIAAEQGGQIKSDAAWSKWVAPGLTGGAAPAVALGALESVLRPYQKEGVAWLNSLFHNGLNGLLADEMGLGKTVQTLAFLTGLPGKKIVVCPSSLVFNWQREASRYTPQLRTLAIQGADRHALFGEPLEAADLVITSYALLRRDIDRYQRREFSAVVLDEAQHIKNPDSQNAQAAFSLKGQRRLALTGTPMENSLADLWSLMNFLMPGYLGNRGEFRERYQLAIEKSPLGPEHRRLAKRLKPCLLRRMKRNVISELPEKIEHVAYCELTTKQNEIYTKLLESTRRQVSEWSTTKNQGQARMLMLTALLRLRQACCDIRLLDLPGVKEMDAPSGKLIMLEELLNEAIDGGHRVLIFSQFTSMLRILRETLENLQISYRYLDGQTKNRAHEVDQFESGAASVFLISLKAGGTGLNLTRADIVIHFDPWWNPAVEDQATDRAHRIGQKSVVNSYKLITRGTIEEKILALQSKKRAVTDATLDAATDGEPLMTGLGMEEIHELFQ